MRSSRFHPPPCLVRGARGTLLLALPLCGLAFYSPAQAQPEAMPPAKAAPSLLSPDDKAAVDQALAIAKYEEVCKSLVDLELKDATLSEVIKAVQDSFPGQKIVVNVRDANSLRVSFLVKQRRVGDVLQAVASLCGCEFYIFADGLLIARPVMLLGGEQLAVKDGRSGQWSKSVAANDVGWSNQGMAQSIFGQAIAREVTTGNFKPDDKGVVKTTFSNFSPEAQGMLQQLATWTHKGSLVLFPQNPPFVLSPDSPVRVDTSNPKAIDIQMSGGASNHDIGFMGTRIFFPKK